ncbi:acyl-CoA dehydrogenase family protein [Actinomadura algeriensis]|uniref:Alkylation response protein AidB-like acyl-CoA dehydrogenase n=1 Tax=Actinomadura algeriensis TaxID=1679523 RepID=A0ABR9JY96_9ACTN|nr:acyl-CoA dehydrogenase family protein [Actinomadura algeriensis]MBE1535552.1 alkylation response protein AidB-like acyl-CoA dehydrogenase [Actinomadura algeriensis]
MDLAFTDDQEALRESLRDFFESEAPPDVVRAAEPLGFDADLWRKVVEMGLPAIPVPAERGGGGAGLMELAIAAECLGRTLAPVPLIEAAAATALLADAAPDHPWTAAAVAGDLLPALALHPATGDVARIVPAGAVADVVVALRGDALVAARTAEPAGTSVPNLGSMPVADRRLDDGETIVLADGPAAVAAHTGAVRRWEALTAAALTGLAARALELGVGYVTERRAFGVLIGGFQAIQHRLADDATALEGARLLTWKAAWARDAGEPDAGALATMALLFAAETAFTTASDSLHMHGGYGYTLEYDVQLYFRRAKAWPLVAGDRRAAYAGLPRRLFGAAPSTTAGV